MKPICYKRVELEAIRQKLGKYVMSLEGYKKLDDENVMKVKGKALNTFLGMVKTDMPRLAIEAFP